ncbi:MAG: phosphoenolpyruvate--protein phosphotransferase [Planctomycetota bacterium]|nr:phosphoenolpyruvate--protein phosphotransferase [Planctomycetota bacterium]
MRRGIGVSPGVAVGEAYCIHEIFVNPNTRRLADSEVLPELDRFERAREATARDLRSLHQKVSTQLTPDVAAIFLTHDTILHDPALTDKIRHRIVEEHQPATLAISNVLHEYSQLFELTTDDYLRERLSDLRDVIVRLSGHLSEVLHPSEQPEVHGPLIVVADELLPSQVIMLGDCQVVGIVTQSGGKTSHAAILARSRGIPAVCGVTDLLREVKNGDLLVLDGREGSVVINPDSESEKVYRKLEREFFDLKDQLAANRDRPAVTSCGASIELLANINNLSDAKAAGAMGAVGVGLYRTEYLFLTHADVPDEEEQLQRYREIIAASPNRQVTIRTLDLGGDKSVSYMGRYREGNPFMGWRSIRLSFEHPEFFLQQIRAILRAAAGEGRIRIMFPMITTLEEIRRAKGMVLRAERQLLREGKPFGNVQIGIMLEVPAAAVCIDTFVEYIDFVSIGSNDLVQYLMAADRDNPRVSHLCEPLSPAVLRVLHRAISVCNQMGKSVTLCGEMAGGPRAFVLLLGMGLRSFSMSPAMVATIKDLMLRLTIPEARQIFEEAMELKTSTQIVKFMGEQLHRIAPNLEALD